MTAIPPSASEDRDSGLVPVPDTPRADEASNGAASRLAAALERLDAALARLDMATDGAMARRAIRGEVADALRARLDAVIADLAGELAGAERQVTKQEDGA